MNEFDFICWVVNIVEAAHSDKTAGKRRFGDDFPIAKLPRSLNRLGSQNLAARIYNVVFDGWDNG
jgi:hypothetical protein